MCSIVQILCSKSRYPSFLLMIQVRKRGGGRKKRFDFLTFQTKAQDCLPHICLSLKKSAHQVTRCRSPYQKWVPRGLRNFFLSEDKNKKNAETQFKTRCESRHPWTPFSVRNVSDLFAMRSLVEQMASVASNIRISKYGHVKDLDLNFNEIIPS